MCSFANGCVGSAEDLRIEFYSGQFDGLGVEASFGQPTGICSEGNTLLWIPLEIKA